MKPILGISMGDPCGIGPEVVLRALASRRARSAAEFVVFGNGAILERVARELRLPLPSWQAPGRGGARGPRLVETGRVPTRLALLGKATALGGRLALACIERAAAWALEGRIHGMVTAPISKEAIQKAGCPWPGHTELLAELTHARRPVMMMVAEGLRVALVTTHVALAQVPNLITRAAVLETLRVVHRDLGRRFGLPRPRIAVCGLNPHAGEAGRLGTEERRTIAPAVRQALAEGIACTGPISADAAFTPRHLAEHDAVVAMYHDQATIPVKMHAFDRTVNVTLGLPIVRTSPGHGTAYDIVRLGRANPASMIEAIRLAARMARNRPSA